MWSKWLSQPISLSFWTRQTSEAFGVIKVANIYIRVVIDDMAFPSYSSSTARSRKTNLDEIGDCFVRELDFSKITLRLREMGESKGGDDKKEHIFAKLTGNTLDTLKQCLVSGIRV